MFVKYDFYTELCSKIGKENVWLTREECLRLQESLKIRPSECKVIPEGFSGRDVGISVPEHYELLGDVVKRVGDDTVILYNRSGTISIISPHKSMTFQKGDENTESLLAIKFIDSDMSYFQGRSKDGKMNIKFYDGESVDYLRSSENIMFCNLNSTDFDKYGIVPDEDVVVDVNDPFRMFIRMASDSRGYCQEVIDNSRGNSITR